MSDTEKIMNNMKKSFDIMKAGQFCEEEIRAIWAITNAMLSATTEVLERMEQADE